MTLYETLHLQKKHLKVGSQHFFQPLDLCSKAQVHENEAKTSDQILQCILLLETSRADFN